MKVCVKVITPAAGAGGAIQTFTGFTDKNGAPFKPKVFIPIGNAPLGSVGTFWAWAHGFDDGTTHVGETSDESNPVSLKDVAAGTSGEYSIMKFHDQLTFGGKFITWAFIKAVRSGEIDVQFDLNDDPGDSYILIALGGDDLDYAILNSIGSGSPVPVGFTPVALINKTQRSFTTTSTGGGALPATIGWATKSDAKDEAAVAAAWSGDVNGGGNTAYYNTGNSFVALTGASSISGKNVSNWGTNSFTFAGDTGATATLALGSILAVSGEIIEPATNVNLDTETGINLKLVILVSVGLLAGNTYNTTDVQIVIGAMDGSRQALMWTGENVIGDTAALHGARTIRNDRLLQFGVPNAGSTTFANIATSGGFISGTKFRTTWTGTDGVRRKAIYLALGSADVPDNPLSGIYKLVKGKTDDTVYTDFDPVTTELMDIPNPFAESGLIGDE